MKKINKNIIRMQIHILFEEIPLNMHTHWSGAISSKIKSINELIKDEEVKELLMNKDYKELFVEALLNFINKDLQKFETHNNYSNTKSIKKAFDDISNIIFNIASINSEVNDNNQKNKFSQAIFEMIYHFDEPQKLFKNLALIINANYYLSKDIAKTIREDMTPIHLIINLLQNTDNNYLNKEKNELIIKEILEFKNWNTFNFIHLKDYLLQRYSLPNDYIFQNASNKQINIINEILIQNDNSPHNYIITETLISNYLIIMKNNEIIFNTNNFKTNDLSVEKALVFDLPKYLNKNFINISCYEVEPETGKTYNIKDITKRGKYIYKINVDKNKEQNPNEIIAKMKLIYESMIEVLMNSLTPVVNRAYFPFEKINNKNFEEVFNKNIRKFNLENLIEEQIENKKLDTIKRKRAKI